VAGGMGRVKRVALRPDPSGGRASAGAVRPDGSIASQAFTDVQNLLDRRYC